MISSCMKSAYLLECYLIKGDHEADSDISVQSKVACEVQEQLTFKCDHLNDGHLQVRVDAEPSMRVIVVPDLWCNFPYCFSKYRPRRIQ